MWEEVGSPRWARTSDFLINSPTPRPSIQVRHDLSTRVLELPVRGHWLMDAGSPLCVGTNAEPRPASLALPAVLLDQSLQGVRQVDPVLVPAGEVAICLGRVPVQARLFVVRQVQSPKPFHPLPNAANLGSFVFLPMVRADVEKGQYDGHAVSSEEVVKGHVLTVPLPRVAVAVAVVGIGPGQTLRVAGRVQGLVDDAETVGPVVFAGEPFHVAVSRFRDQLATFVA